MTTYPKVTAVEPLPGKRLRVTFANGAIRIYDCTPLLREQPFRLLSEETFFRTVHADTHGYGVMWHDEVDLAESELWIHGMTERATAPDAAEGRAQ